MPKTVPVIAAEAVTGQIAASGVRSTRTSQRREQMGAFYTRQAPRLRKIVAARVLADEHTIEDACAYAWERLVADDEIVLDRRGLAWLAMVAIREAWRLTAAIRRECPGPSAQDASAAEGRLEKVRPGVEDDALAAVEHRERVTVFRTLKARERRELFLQALGYRYEEIAAMTGSSYTGVNRRLAEGRAQLRRRERDRMPASAEPASLV
jgi:DNA-directed RNA polymerase specialized sigma24 family protein